MTTPDRKLNEMDANDDFDPTPAEVWANVLPMLEREEADPRGDKAWARGARFMRDRADAVIAPRQGVTGEAGLRCGCTIHEDREDPCRNPVDICYRCRWECWGDTHTLSPDAVTGEAGLRERLPNEREVARWDREHRRECQEASCTLPHRMLAFADWYIVIASEMEARVRAALATGDGGEVMTIVVVFLDGSEQCFSNADYRVREGVLEVWEDSYAGRRNSYHFPLANIRTWRVER